MGNGTRIVSEALFLYVEEVIFTTDANKESNHGE
jgi:hypothetical protein